MSENFNLNQESDDDEAPKEERTRLAASKFLESWFGGGEEDEDEDDGKEKESSIYEKISEKFKNLFGSIAKIEKVEKTPEPVLVPIEAPVEAATEPEEQIEEIGEAIATTEATMQPETETDEPEGLLIVPHDETEVLTSAEDEMEEIETTASEVQESFEHDDTEIPMMAAMSRVEQPPHETTPEPSPVPEKKHTSTAVSAGDILKKDKEKLLKKKVKKIEDETKSLKKEQSEFEQKQKDFEAKLERENARKKAEQRERLRQARNHAEAIYVAPEWRAQDVSEPAREKVEPVLVPAYEAPAIESVRTERILETRPSVSESAMAYEELEPKSSIVSERAYERRHEAVGERFVPAQAAMGSIGQNSTTTNGYAGRARELHRFTKNKTRKWPISELKFTLGEDMYKQAVSSGFWTALVLIALFYVIMRFVG